MVYCTREVTKEIYERAKENRGYMTDADKQEIFSPSLLYGYGVYGAKVYEENGKYICHYSRGNTCD